MVCSDCSTVWKAVDMLCLDTLVVRLPIDREVTCTGQAPRVLDVVVRVPALASIRCDRGQEVLADHARGSLHDD